MSFAGLNEQRFGDYILERELGRGASATIYLARHKNSEQNVSLKIFHPRLFQEPRFMQRIRREFKVVSALDHPNVIAIRDFLDQSDPPALVMDFIDGDNLEKFQCRLPYSLPEVSVLIAIEILKALHYSHSKHVIHRDLKPENILISRHGQVFVTDFGLARFQEAATILTQPNHILGSPEYMAPEQAGGESTSTRSDLFSLGGILYFFNDGNSTLFAIHADSDLERHSP